MKRTVENCAFIKKMLKKRQRPPEKQGELCLGYGKAYGDDEPCDTCKKCILCTAHENEMNEAAKAVKRAGVGAMQTAMSVKGLSNAIHKSIATGILEQLAEVFFATPSYKVTKGKYSFARSTLYEWRKGKAYTLTPRFLLLLDSLGYRLRIEKIPDKERDGR